MKKRETTRNITLIAAMSTIALMFSYLEVIFPFNIGIPGVKLGIANLIIIISLYILKPKEAFLINMIRVVLSGILFGGLFVLIYSMAGAIFSFVVMYLLKMTNKFSIVGVSMAGGVFHNLGQLVFATIIMEDLKIFLYFPVLLFSGLITGIMIGFIANMIKNRIGKIKYI